MIYKLIMDFLGRHRKLMYYKWAHDLMNYCYSKRIEAGYGNK
jgi:hypothetical protein